MNGVFLVALCLSIFLEAIQRFVEPQHVSNPKLVLIVGCFGLASNLLGLLLFHAHSHGGGGEEGHGHSHDEVSHAEEGHSHVHGDSDDHAHHHVTDERGSIADVLPQVTVAGFKGSESPVRNFNKSDEENTTISGRTSNSPRKSHSNGEVHARHQRRMSGSFGRGFGSVDNIHVHPASFRRGIVQEASRLEERPDSEDEEEEEALLDDNAVDSPNETSRVLSFPNGSPRKSLSNGSPKKSAPHTNTYGSIQPRHSVYEHANHHHRKPRDAGGDSHGHGGHGHSHGDLNMRGVFLHVMGDALGNIGVIVSALIIWLTHFPGRYYFDPGVSLLITIIILYSAIPLCKAASRILLQAVPVGLSIDEITADIESLPRVLEAHHLHVWQLSDTKLIASLHVKVDCEIEGTGSASYMHLAREIRRCLHEFGIHSSTIQPEFCNSSMEEVAADADAAGSSGHLSPKVPGSAAPGSKATSVISDGRKCMLDCDDDCEPQKKCCSGSNEGGSAK